MILKTALLAFIAVTGTAHALPVSGQGTWETTLQSRDLNDDGVTDAFYDSSLNITWLRTGSLDTYNWTDAGNWASQDRYGISGWRLPTAIGDGSGTGPQGCGNFAGYDCGFNPPTKSGDPYSYQEGQVVYSEMAHLFYVTLGNLAKYDPSGAVRAEGQYGLTNTGEFYNFRRTFMWSGTTFYYQGAPSESAYSFQSADGSQGFNYKDLNLLGAFAVHDGDVSPIPEPETYALMLAGLAMVGAAARRRKVISA